MAEAVGDGVDAHVGEHPAAGAGGVDHPQGVVEAVATHAQAQRLGDAKRDVVAEDGQNCDAGVEVDNLAPQCGATVAPGPVELAQVAGPGQAVLDAFGDGAALVEAQRPAGHVVGAGHLGADRPLAGVG